MKTYYLKWIAASLGAPLVVVLTSGLAYSSGAQMLMLVVWPTSIFLMALGGDENSLYEVIQVWFFAVTPNMVLYAFIGFIVSLFKGAARNGA